MTTETIKTDRLADVREWLSDRWDGIVSVWPLVLLVVVLVALFGYLGHQIYSDWRYQTDATEACSAGRTDACKAYVTGEAIYSQQQTFMLDYKLATGKELK